MVPVKSPRSNSVRTCAMCKVSGPARCLRERPVFSISSRTHSWYGKVVSMGALVLNKVGKPHWRCMSMRARCRTRQYSGEKVAAFSASASGIRPAVAFLQPPSEDQRLKSYTKCSSSYSWLYPMMGPRTFFVKLLRMLCLPFLSSMSPSSSSASDASESLLSESPVCRACCLLSSVALTTVSQRFVCQ